MRKSNWKKLLYLYICSDKINEDKNSILDVEELNKMALKKLKEILIEWMS